MNCMGRLACCREQLSSTAQSANINGSSRGQARRQQVKGAAHPALPLPATVVMVALSGSSALRRWL